MSYMSYMSYLSNFYKFNNLIIKDSTGVRALIPQDFKDHN